MTDNELIQRMSNFEDNYTERKSRGIRPQEIRQTLSAFANSVEQGHVGVLFVGIDDRTAEVNGVENPDELQQKIADTAAKECYPPIENIKCRVLTINGKAVVAALIGPSENRPHFTGPAYVRVGSQSRAASEAMFKELIASQNEKTGRILQMREKAITLRGEGRRISNPRAAANHIEQGEGTIRSCDAFHVVFELWSAGFPITVCSEPLSAIDISFDVVKRREMLIIRPVNGNNS